ncbi:DUF2723 domain-containing protein [Pedobacter sp. JCM 36344]|uniref:glycosyltransferase family 117 protein n=1 Tax=Pedobacter sp. JCM 36344 TaxID=3374280 RepID=UPI00397D5B14
MIKNYQKLNNIVGLVLFIVAASVYFLTMEPTVSFWDCGEFIAASYKLQVGHQPGAPLFLMIGKLFSMLAIGNTAKIAYWMNFSSVLFSAATVTFLYWSITMLASKVIQYKGTTSSTLSVISAGVIGALAFTFSDTFWFSAVEAEVYSLSLLFTAIVFWAALKWERNLDNRWLVLIAFVIGLSIGVHLLSLLAIPAIVLVYYFKKTSKVTLMGIFKAMGIAAAIWITVQNIVIQYFVLMAAKLDIFFVNTLKMSFGTGAGAFLLAIIVTLSYGIYYSVKHKKYNLNLSLTCLTFVIFGFSSYFLIIIRANAKTTLNLSNPDNALSLYKYLGRTNYGDTPLLYGQTFDADVVNYKETGIEYRTGEKSYEISGKTSKPEFDKNLLFPRTYSQKPNHSEFYKDWLHLEPGQTPTFLQNLSFFTSYQLGFMYWRYFFWNFVGRQNDIQSYGPSNDGNWTSGIKPLDAIRLGNQSKLPPSIINNEGHNKFYGLPLALGIMGIIFLYRKNRNDLAIVATLFAFTGLAIIVYLNQDPMQVRERDYAYVGSFYAFAIFIGLGVLGIESFLSKLNMPKVSLAMASLTCLFAVPFLMGAEGWDEHDRSNKTTALDWAKNYLNSCAPNAILFTNADNDTFPLWYVQEVEDYRTDVRVVNIQYLSDGNYIEQMLKQSGKSAPLPIRSDPKKYIKGNREWMPYMEYGFTDSVELKDILAVMTSDAPEDKVQLSDGSMENFLPTKKLKLTIDPAQIIKTKTLAVKDIAKIASTIEWTYRENVVFKANLAIFDILVSNNWERPIYFGTSISTDSYVGLEKYLYLEGYAYRLLPVKSSVPDKEFTMEGQTNTDVMYDNMMQKLDFQGFKSAKYQDPESRRIAGMTAKYMNNLSVNLLEEGKPDKAKQLMNKAVKQLPYKIYSIEDTLIKVYTVNNLYAVKESKTANTLSRNTAAFIVDELSYIASLDSRRRNSYGREIQIGVQVLASLDKMATDNHQADLSIYLKQILEKIQTQFG